MLAAQTHRLFARWNELIKAKSTVNPWEFIGLLLSKINFEREFASVIKKAQIILGLRKMELVTRNLPSSTTDW